MPALLGMTALGFSGHAVLFPTVPLWVVDSGGDPASAGAVNAVLMLCTVLMQLFVPLALRRIGWNATLTAGMILLGLPSLLHLLPIHIGGALALAIPRGFGFGILTVCGAAAVASLVNPARLGKAIGAYGLAIAGPHALLLPVAPWLAQNAGFALVFVIGAGPLIAAFFTRGVARHLARPGTRVRSSPRIVHSLQRARAVRPLVPPMLILLAVTAAGGALLTFAPQMMPEPGLVFAGLLTFTVIAAVSRWLAGSLADRYGTRPFVAPAICVTAAGVLLIAWAIGQGEHSHSAALIIGMAAVGVAYGALQNFTLIDSFAAAGRDKHATASAVWNIGFDAGTGAGAMVIGAIATQTAFSTALLAAAVLSVLTLPLAACVGRHHRQNGGT